MLSRILTLLSVVSTAAVLGCGSDPVTPIVPEPEPSPLPAPTPGGPVAPWVTSFAITMSRDTLRAGDTARVAVAATWSDSASRELPVTFEAQGGMMAGSLFTAGTSVGTFVLAATCACGAVEGAEPGAPAEVHATAEVTIQADSRAVLEVPLRLHRMDGGSGDVLVSNGIPLPPGWLPDPAAPPPVRITIGGVEVRRYVEVLKGKHKDGSAMSVLVQFVWPRTATGDAVLEIDAPSALPPRTKVDLNGEMPAAAALPIDPEYLVGTLIVGPTVSRFNAPQSPSYFPAYEAMFDQKANTHWASYGANWGALNYYDRVLNHFAFWVRTGDPVLWERASRIAIDYRKGYIEANAYGVAEWWTYLDGLALHYWLAGDEVSRKAVYLTADNIHGSRGGESRIGNNTTHPYNDNRTQAKVLGAKILAHRLEAPSVGSISDWKAAARLDLGWILSTQDPSGGFFFENICGASSNFMAGMLSSVFVDYFEYVEQDSRIRDSVQRLLDWLWETQWRPEDQVYNYYSKECATGGPTPGWDLNGFFLESYGWLYSQTGDPRYLVRGDATFAGLVEKTWFDQPKMFNQAFQFSWRYLAYRR